MTLQTGQQEITKHILPNILRSKDNQAVKFGQLIKYSVRSIFYKYFFMFLGCVIA